MVLGILLFFLYRPLLEIRSPAQLGLAPFRLRCPDIFKGFFLALGSVLVLVAVMSLSEIFIPGLRLSFPETLRRLLEALLAALTAGLLEEIFFRGVILKGLLEDLRMLPAFVVSSLFYSAIHFVKPAEQIYLSRIEPWAGIRHVLLSFQPFLDPAELLPGLFGLFLIGLVLSYAFLRTGSLYLSIGLHAGWIFGLKTIRVYGDYRREDLGWLFGSSDPKLVSGVAAWTGILAVGLVVHSLTRKRQGLWSRPLRHPSSLEPLDP